MGMRLFMALTLMESLVKNLEWKPSVPISPFVRHAYACSDNGLVQTDYSVSKALLKWSIRTSQSVLGFRGLRPFR